VAEAKEEPALSKLKDLNLIAKKTWCMNNRETKKEFCAVLQTS
jgi:hypothetical protein